MSKEAMKLALEALELINLEFVCANGSHHAKKDRHEWDEDCPITDRWRKAITALREALAEQPAQQEPVTWGVDWGQAGQIPCVSIIKRLPRGGIEVVAVEYGPTPPSWIEIQQVKWEGDKLLAKLKEKNT